MNIVIPSEFVKFSNIYDAGQFCSNFDLQCGWYQLIVISIYTSKSKFELRNCDYALVYYLKDVKRRFL